MLVSGYLAPVRASSRIGWTGSWLFNLLLRVTFMENQTPFLVPREVGVFFVRERGITRYFFAGDCGHEKCGLGGGWHGRRIAGRRGRIHEFHEFNRDGILG